MNISAVSARIRETPAPGSATLRPMTTATMSDSTKSGKKRRKQRQKKKRQRNWRTAAGADRHELYELSVQEPEAEGDFIEQVWAERRGRRCESIREDFCGTAAVCMEWVRRRREHTAIGIDLDESVLDWGRRRMPDRLSKSQMQRVTLIHGDVMKVEPDPVDCALAMNFSYMIFKTRRELKKYFMRVCRGIKADGLFLLDAYGGSDALLELKEDRDLDGFTYIWDQAYYNPINAHAINHIHFRFPDGTKLKKAFTYDWRLWTLPELQELLLEAGFSNVVVYWEGTDEDTGEGDGEWSAETEGEACPGWIAYLVAEK